MAIAPGTGISGIPSATALCAAAGCLQRSSKTHHCHVRCWHQCECWDTRLQDARNRALLTGATDRPLTSEGHTGLSDQRGHRSHGSTFRQNVCCTLWRGSGCCVDTYKAVLGSALGLSQASDHCQQLLHIMHIHIVPMLYAAGALQPA